MNCLLGMGKKSEPEQEFCLSTGRTLPTSRSAVGALLCRSGAKALAPHRQRWAQGTGSRPQLISGKNLSSSSVSFFIISSKSVLPFLPHSWLISSDHLWRQPHRTTSASTTSSSSASTGTASPATSPAPWGRRSRSMMASTPSWAFFSFPLSLASFSFFSFYLSTFSLLLSFFFGLLAVSSMKHN